MGAPRPEILFIAHRVPYPPDRGDKIRSYHELKHLAGLAPVHLAALADDAADAAHGAALEGLTASRCVAPRTKGRAAGAIEGLLRREPLSVTLFRHRALDRYIRATLARRPIGAVFVFSGNMGAHVPLLLAGQRLIVDFCDVDSAKYAAYGQSGAGPVAWINRREGRRLGAFEQALARRATLSLFASVDEAALFGSPEGADIAVLGNGVDLDYFDPATPWPRPEAMAGEGPCLLFTGQMDYRPNIEAVETFARDALPAIRRAHPAARFFIVGRNPASAVRALCDCPGVTVTGAVPDMRPWLAHADIVVAPLRIARGIQNKVLEAMAMARPVVASVAAAMGVDAVAGRDLIVDDDAARSIVQLLNDPASRAAIGEAARARMQVRYGWEAALAPLGPWVLGHG